MLHRRQQSFVYRNLVRWSHFASSGRGWGEDLCLHVRWQIGIDGKDDQFCYLWSQPPASILEHLATCFDFFLKKMYTSKETLRKKTTKKLRYFQAVQLALWLFWSTLKKVLMRLRQTVVVWGHPELFPIIAPKYFCSCDNVLFISRPANDWIMMSTHQGQTEDPHLTLTKHVGQNIIRLCQINKLYLSKLNVSI